VTSVRYTVTLPPIWFAARNPASTHRALWFNTSVNAELAGRMFEGYSRYRFALPQAPVIDRTTEWVSELPAVASAQDSPHVRRD